MFTIFGLLFGYLDLPLLQIFCVCVLVCINGIIYGLVVCFGGKHRHFLSVLF